MLAEEVGLMLSEGVVEAPMDIDLAMITGAGFQFWNGGLIPLLDREGLTEKVLGRRVLPTRLQSEGFTFRFPTLPEALADLLP